MQLVGAVTNLFGKRRRRGLEDIIGMSKEDKEKACQKLGTPGPLTKELIREVFNKVDASKSSGSGEWLYEAPIRCFPKTKCGYL